MSVRLNSDKAEGQHTNIALVFTDINEQYILKLSNSVLHHYVYDGNTDVDATLTLTHELFVQILIGKASIKNTLFSDDLKVDGSIIDLISFFMLFDKPSGQFNIVTP